MNCRNGSQVPEEITYILHFWVKEETVWYIVRLTLLSKNLKVKYFYQTNAELISAKKQTGRSQADGAERSISLFYLSLSFFITCGSCLGFNSSVVMEVGYFVHLITYLVCKSKTLCAASTCNQ